MSSLECLSVCLIVFLVFDTCSSEGLGDSFKLSIEDQDFTCNQGSDPTSPTQQGGFCNRIPCQLISMNESLRLREENEMATGTALWCNSFKVFLPCLKDLIANDCVLDPDELAEFEAAIIEIQDVFDFYDDNCMCLDSAEVNPKCQNADPCEVSSPCLNGGRCVSRAPKRRGYRGSSWRGSSWRRGRHYDYDQTKSSDITFVKCKCPKGFSGDFCQNCDTCKQCRRFDKCECPRGYGGPTCSLTCKSIKKSKRELYQACLQVTMDDYYNLFFQSQCFINFEMGQCIAATAQNCGFEPADVGEDTRLRYWIFAVGVVETLLPLGGCAIFGDIPLIQ